MLYAKLFTSIYQGTLRGNSHGLLVFTNLLAHADSCGIVDVHPRAIAEEVGLTQDEVRAALLVLEAPDVESRSPEEEGRRIIRVDEHRAWGWRIVNYLKYRAIRNEEDRKEQNRLAQQRWREKQKPSNANKPRKPESAQAEAEAEAEAKKEREQRRASRLPPDWAPNQALVDWAMTERPDVDPNKTVERFRDFWTAKAGRDAKKLDWDATFRNWVRSEKSAMLPNRRASPPASETAYQRSMRERVASICPSIAAKPPNHSETFDVTAKTLDRADICEVDADLRAGVPLSLGRS